jgi:hypothetical protein
MWLTGEIFRNSLEKTTQKRQKVVKVIQMKSLVSNFTKVSKPEVLKSVLMYGYWTGTFGRRQTHSFVQSLLFM